MNRLQRLIALCVLVVCLPALAWADIISNDQCSDATGPLTVPSVTAGSTSGAVLDPDVPYCGTSATVGGVWYSVFGTGHTMTATTCYLDSGQPGSTTYDTKISVFCEDCEAHTCVTGNDDTPGGGVCGGTWASTVTWCSELGAEYKVFVHGFASAQGNFELSVYDDDTSCGGAYEGICLAPPPAEEPPTGCEVSTGTFSNDEVVEISDATNDQIVTSTIEVTGLESTIWDVNVLTNLVHSYSSDLLVTVTSPQGTVVTLTTGNGGSNDDIFDGTTWSDGADPGGQVPYGAGNRRIATDHSYSNGGTADPLTPEESMNAFFGENPNGTWTLSIADRFAGEGGQLNGWSLEISALPAGLTQTESSFNNADVNPISDHSSTQSEVNVAALSGVVCGVEVTTNITHTWASDLDITLMSPSGKKATLTTDNGGSSNNVFNGTVWSDQADAGGALVLPYPGNNGLVTDASYSNNVTAGPLVPEETFGLFNGEDPNGTWTLTIYDDAGADQGSSAGWSLELTTCEYADSDSDGTADVCESVCEEQEITSTLTAMDGSANTLDKVGVRIRKALRRASGNRRAGKNTVVANHALYLNAWSLTWSIDRIQRSDCTNAHLCVAVNNGGSLAEYTAIVQNMYDNNKRLLRKLKRALGERTRRWRRMNRRNNVALDNALAALANVPLDSQSCS